jgi:putative oxidoreductase
MRPGPLFAFAAGAAELSGGVLFGTGLLTPVAAAVVASTMLVAARTDHAGKGLWIYNGGFEYVLTNAAVVIGFAFAGAGEWSLDHAIGWDVAGTWWGIGAVVAAALGGAACSRCAVFRPGCPSRPARCPSADDGRPARCPRAPRRPAVSPRSRRRSPPRAR